MLLVIGDVKSTSLVACPVCKTGYAADTCKELQNLKLGLWDKCPKIKVAHEQDQQNEVLGKLGLEDV